MAALTIGVCLGSMLAVALTMLLGKLLGPVLANVNYAYLSCYYLGFVLFLGYSFWRGAALAAYQGLLLLSLFCLLLPLATVYLAWQQAQWHTAVATMGVDGMAICFAAVFFAAACKTKKRILHSRDDGVWSVPAATATLAFN